MTSEEEVRGVCVCVRCLCGYNRFYIMQWVFTCLNVPWMWALHNDNDGEVDGGQTERESGCESENIRFGFHFCSEGSDLVIGLQLVEGFPQSLIKPSHLFYTHTSRYSSSISHPTELRNTEMKSTSGFCSHPSSSGSSWGQVGLYVMVWSSTVVFCCSFAVLKSC